jgi:ABC-type microcin C transport system permease subunit YejB
MSGSRNELFELVTTVLPGGSSPFCSIESKKYVFSKKTKGIEVTRILQREIFTK